MKFTNILSVIGLMVSGFFFYAKEYLGFPGPGYHASLVNLVILCAFAVSYVLSLMDARTTALRVVALLATFLGCAITALFSVLVLLDRGTYPQVMNISGAYVEFVLFLVLMYKWAKQH